MFRTTANLAGAMTLTAILPAPEHGRLREPEPPWKLAVTRTERLLSLIQFLRRQRRPVTGQKLAREMGVSPRLTHLTPILIVERVEPCLEFWTSRFGLTAENRVPGRSCPDRAAACSGGCSVQAARGTGG